MKRLFVELKTTPEPARSLKPSLIRGFRHGNQKRRFGGDDLENIIGKAAAL